MEAQTWMASKVSKVQEPRRPWRPHFCIKNHLFFGAQLTKCPSMDSVNNQVYSSTLFPSSLVEVTVEVGPCYHSAFLLENWSGKPMVPSFDINLPSLENMEPWNSSSSRFRSAQFYLLSTPHVTQSLKIIFNVISSYKKRRVLKKRDF